MIDASIARAAGPESATYPTSVRCRDFLRDVLDICHRMVMTPEIRAEWKRQRSGYASSWQTQMTARKKIVCVQVPDEGSLATKLDALDLREKAREAMQKDCLLVEAAQAADSLVVSLDDTVRTHFADRSRVNSRAQGDHVGEPGPRGGGRVCLAQKGRPIREPSEAPKVAS